MYPYQSYRSKYNKRDTSYDEMEKRDKLRKKFITDLTSWAGTSIVLLAMDFFLSGGMTWSRYPLFFYGIFMLMQFFKFIRIQYAGADYESRRTRRRERKRHRNTQHEEDPIHSMPVEDYTEVLLRQEERELAELKDYRQPGKLWKDEDLV